MLGPGPCPLSAAQWPEREQVHRKPLVLPTLAGGWGRGRRLHLPLPDRSWASAQKWAEKTKSRPGRGEGATGCSEGRAGQPRPPLMGAAVPLALPLAGPSVEGAAGTFRGAAPGAGAPGHALHRARLPQPPSQRVCPHLRPGPWGRRWAGQGVSLGSGFQFPPGHAALGLCVRGRVWCCGEDPGCQHMIGGMRKSRTLAAAEASPPEPRLVARGAHALSWGTQGWDVPGKGWGAEGSLATGLGMVGCSCEAGPAPSGLILGGPAPPSTDGSVLAGR